MRSAKVVFFLFARFALAAPLAACTRAPPTPAPNPNPASAASTANAANASGTVAATPGAHAAADASTNLPDADANSTGAAAARAPLDGDDAEAVLFVDSDRAARETACPKSAGARGRAACLVDLRYANDPAAQKIARELYEKHGIVAGVERDHFEDMAWRGRIHIVPEPASGKYRTHLEWLGAAARDFDALFAKLDPDRTRHFRYAWRPFAVRYMRSVGRTTPSAYASFDRWELAYNVVGSLNTSETAVRELFFHELFHRNDGDDGHWSERVLLPVYRAIVHKCGTKIACLTPYTPTTTTVRGGTYYAFQPEDYDPVHEYGAELAIRWYREQRAIAMSLPPVTPFKCGPAENARAWALIVNEFFAGVDLVPPCK